MLKGCASRYGNRRATLVLLAMLTLGSCSDYPRDIAGTADRVVRDQQIHIGFVAGELERGDRPAIDRFIAHLEQSTHARVVGKEANSEQLFEELKAGQLDLVVGRFADETPWQDDVAVIEPFSGHAQNGRDRLARAAARNGENRWIIQVEAATRNARSGS